MGPWTQTRTHPLRSPSPAEGGAPESPRVPEFWRQDGNKTSVLRVEASSLGDAGCPRLGPDRGRGGGRWAWTFSGLKMWLGAIGNPLRLAEASVRMLGAGLQTCPPNPYSSQGLRVATQ